MDLVVHPFAKHIEPPYVPCSWSPEYVEKRLVDAFHVSKKLPGGSGAPNRISGCWPVYRDEWGDLIARAGSLDDPEVMRTMSDAQKPKRTTSVEISLHDEAMCWIGRYIGNRRDEAVALQIWVIGSATGAKRGSLALQAGIQPGHVKALAQRGLDRIKSGLCRDFVELRSPS